LCALMIDVDVGERGRYKGWGVWLFGSRCAIVLVAAARRTHFRSVGVR
jgi:hypothetical protein